MAITATRSVLLLVAVWFCVAESQDAVEPLTLLEVAEPDMQQALADMQHQNQILEEKKEELATAASVNAAETEVTMQEKEKKDEIQAASDAGSSDDSSDMDPVVKAGITLSDQTAKENAKLQAELAQERSKNQAMEEKTYQSQLKSTTAEIKEKFAAKGPVAPEYNAIPFFMYTTLAKKVDASNQLACEAVCSAQRSCKSYTWNVKERNCWWSVEKLTYNDDYFYSAKNNGGGEGEKWNDTPGLRWTTPMSKNLYKISLEECREACEKEGASCSAIAYKTNTRTCIRSGEALPTDPHATYYEKRKSPLDKEEADAIAEARKKLTTDFEAKQIAQKAINKQEQEKASRESNSKRTEKEIFQKQLPSKSQERDLKTQVEKQVMQEKIKLQENKIKAEEKAELRQAAESEKRKMLELKKLQTLADKKAKASDKVAKVQKKLRATTVKLQAAEQGADEATKNLDSKLDEVAQAHKSAETSLLAFQDLQNQTDTNPEIKNTARLAVEEKHTDLAEKVQGAELAHTKEVESKKAVSENMKKEARVAKKLDRVKAFAAKQKVLDERAVQQSQAEAHKQQIVAAKGKLDLAKSGFNALKVRELGEKQKHAAAVAQQAVLEHELKSAKAAKRLKEQAKLKVSKELNTKATIALGDLNAKFKENLATLMMAKETYTALLDGDAKKKASKESADQQIASVEEGLEDTP